MLAREDKERVSARSTVKIGPTQGLSVKERIVVNEQYCTAALVGIGIPLRVSAFAGARKGGPAWKMTTPTFPDCCW